MKSNDSALFLLNAIGEISEKTIAEAEPRERESAPIPERKTMRRASAIAAAIILLIAITAVVTIGMGIHTPANQPPSSLTGKSPESVSIDYAVKVAQNTLDETGVKAVFKEASLIADDSAPYYLVRLSTDDGVYDCAVDAESGKVISIAFSSSATESKPEAADKAEDGVPDEIYDDSGELSDSDEIADTAGKEAKKISSHSAAVVSSDGSEESAKQPAQYPDIDTQDIPSVSINSGKQNNNGSGSGRSSYNPYDAYGDAVKRSIEEAQRSLSENFHP